MASLRRSAERFPLVYVSDAEPGIRRRRRDDGTFEYLGPSGRPLQDPRVIDRIRKLAIPPAYEDVWICRDPRGHIQATGRDARGRKQYRYHARWRASKAEQKFSRSAAFAHALPALRRRIRADLRRPGLPVERVLATTARLLEATLIRIGNPEYARENGSYGLTTMRCRHVRVRGSRLEFGFVGKGSKRHDVALSDRSLAGIVKRCQELPGQALFQYLDDRGRARKVRSTDVNRYLRDAMGESFTAKDFRTWAATVEVARAFDEGARLTPALERAAHLLGNTPAICRKSYVHPEVLAAFDDEPRAQALRDAFAFSRAGRWLDADERAVLRYLEHTRARPHTRRKNATTRHQRTRRQPWQTRSGTA